MASVSSKSTPPVIIAAPASGSWNRYCGNSYGSIEKMSAIGYSSSHRPAGATSGTADYDLDDGPWGMACGRGAIAGTAVMPDGDVACITDRSTASAVPAGLDLTLSPQSTVGGQILFRGPDCDIRARLTSARGAARAWATSLHQ